MEEQCHNMRESSHTFACPFLLLPGAGRESVLPGMGREGLELGCNLPEETEVRKA